MKRRLSQRKLKILGVEDDEFAEKLVAWADTIRKTFFDGGVDEIIATRRLIHIVKAFSIFGDRTKAVELCVARFDDETKESFLDLYKKIAGEAASVEDAAGAGTEEEPSEVIPF